MAVLAPIPRARDSTAMMVKVGDLVRERRANRTSWAKRVMSRIRWNPRKVTQESGLDSVGCFPLNCDTLRVSVVTLLVLGLISGRWRTDESARSFPGTRHNFCRGLFPIGSWARGDIALGRPFRSGQFG